MAEGEMMTDFTKEQIEAMNEHLAGVTGWHIDSSGTRDFWMDVFGAIKAVAKESHGLHDTWQPHTDISQAMMVLDTFKEYEIFKDYDYHVRINFYLESPSRAAANDPSLPLAICIAACKATGYKRNEI